MIQNLNLPTLYYLFDAWSWGNLISLICWAVLIAIGTRPLGINMKHFPRRLSNVVLARTLLPHFWSADHTNGIDRPRRVCWHWKSSKCDFCKILVVQHQSVSLCSLHKLANMDPSTMSSTHRKISAGTLSCLIAISLLQAPPTFPGSRAPIFPQKDETNQIMPFRVSHFVANPSVEQRRDIICPRAVFSFSSKSNWPNVFCQWFWQNYIFSPNVNFVEWDSKHCISAHFVNFILSLCVLSVAHLNEISVT